MLIVKVIKKIKRTIDFIGLKLSLIARKHKNLNRVSRSLN